MRPQPPNKAVTLPWMEPLELARLVNADDYCLLYSSLATSYSGQKSLLACHPAETLESTEWKELEQCLSTNRHALENAWFGYLGYGLKDSLESLPRDMPDIVDFPPLRFARYQTIYCFDHALRKLTRCGPDAVGGITATAPPTPPAITRLLSNMTKEEYLRHVATIREAIHAGELYQANLTRKFHGSFQEAPDPLALFATLCEISPAPYSALIRWPGHAILSSSPERFLTGNADGGVTTRPIKGSAPRSVPAEALASSPKDRAENLMIVDLMRNDLARSCQPGSVRVERLFEVESFSTVHHLSSTVCGLRSPAMPPIGLVKNCFPPGSMTGAPKIRAMRLCTALERQSRGVYSGALGWFGGDGSFDLSVVIRTLLLQNERFAFQVGGGIVADSRPEEEWRETMVKATGIAGALGISLEKLENI